MTVDNFVVTEAQGIEFVNCVRVFDVVANFIVDDTSRGYKPSRGKIALTSYGAYVPSKVVEPDI